MEDVEKNSQAEPNTVTGKTDQKETSNIDNNSCQSLWYSKSKQLLSLLLRYLESLIHSSISELS